MFNKTLHALTNRPGPFLTTSFVGDPAFIPAVLSSDLNKLRSQLFLDNTATDYYLKVYLALLESFPDISEYFSDQIKTYRMQDFYPQGVEISGGELWSVAIDFGYFTDPPQTTLPLALTYQIDFTGPESCQISILETGSVRSAECATTASNLLRINWPSDIPFQGLLKLNQVWGVGSRLTINTAPSRFPFSTLAAQLKNNPLLPKLLLQFGVVADYNNAVEPSEKIALALAVVALSNPAVYP